ncbi:hypothetical protein FA13DRAFT_207629 [Coprinellus micaceus]|uniref:Uncharacterized protein n=1 Tax=Coprinellus micaceus TaxID=71717 RepID=A0A4Y7SFE5_COPMI|nr:hypothetical protein FA13DRAFT_207629 [Coprinellus micaceus]
MVGVHVPRVGFVHLWSWRLEAVVWWMWIGRFETTVSSFDGSVSISLRFFHFIYGAFLFSYALWHNPRREPRQATIDLTPNLCAPLPRAPISQRTWRESPVDGKERSVFLLG